MKSVSKLKLAHFNPKELEELDSWQNGRTDIGGSDLRHLSGVEKLLSNPDNEKIIMKSYEKHAKGGRIGDLLRDADRMRHKGRNGDSEMALIGPNTERVFNRLMHGGSVNPHTGKCEYFNLGGFLGGIGKTLKGGMNGIMQGPVKQLAGTAMKALPGIIQGGMMGGPEGALAGGAASMLGGGNGGAGGGGSSGSLGQMFMNSPMGQSKYGQMAQNMGNQAQQMYGRGQEMMNSPMGQAAMNSQYGQRAQKAASPYMRRGQNAYNQGQGMYNQANQGYQNMMNQGQQYNQQANGGYGDQQDEQSQYGMYGQ